MIRVLHVVGSSKFGGATKVIFSLIAMARQHGLEAEILTDDPLTIEACQERGIGVFRFRGIDRPIRPHKDLWATVRLARRLRGRYEVVHTHTSKAGAIGRVAAWIAGVPAILYANHGWYFHELSGRLSTLLLSSAERILALMGDRIICVNEWDRQKTIDMRIAPPHKVATVYNGIPEDQLRPGRNTTREELLAELNLPLGSCLCVHVGRLAEQKGLPYLFEAFAIACRNLPEKDLHLAMVGDGELQADGERWVEQHGVADRVHFLGFRSDAIRWTGGADLTVNSSLWEGHSISLLEYMGCGKPIVATNIRGNRESITHEHDGILVPPADAKGLAEGMTRLISDPDLARRLAGEARRTFERRFTLDRMLENTWTVYEGLLKEKGLL